MKIMIDKNIFSNGQYLVLNNEEYSWHDDLDSNFDLFLDINKHNTLNDYLSLYDFEPLEFIEEKHRRMMLSVGSSNPPWKHVLPTRIYSKKIDDLHAFLKNMKGVTTNRYSNIFSEGNEILQNLNRFCPNENLLKKSIENATVSKTIQSFRPQKDGLTSRIEYNRFKTVTGRLVVKSGPQVLLLPREMKNIFKSRYENGKILWIDFVSLEPRLAKLMTSNSAKEDIYNDIIEEYKLTYSRKKVKAAVLSTLFGAGISKLTEIVGKEAIIIKKAIDEYFDLKSILKKTGDFKSGKIKNYFGRPITLKRNTANIAVNNFIQSTGVDVSLFGFSKISKKMPSSFKPLAVVHDALVADVNNFDLEEVCKIVKEGVDIPDIGHFYLECDII
jgi:hypothetical protein